MSHHHSHDHHHHHHSSKNIGIAFFLNLLFTVIEFFGGIYVNSVAIVSDAIHDLGDTISIGTSWYLQNKSEKKSNSHFSFGYQRFSLLGAFINSVVLILGSVFVVSEAVERIVEPEASDAVGMMYFAFLGVAVNGFAAWKVSHGASLNEKVISWHLIEDVLGWVAVLLVSIVMQFTENLYLDPILSLAITIFIVWNVIKRLKETIVLFLQGAPREITLESVLEMLLRVDGIASAHHSHLWSLDGEHHVFTSHVKLDRIGKVDEIAAIKKRIKDQLSHFSFSHCTIEIELEGERCEFE